MNGKPILKESQKPRKERKVKLSVAKKRAWDAQSKYIRKLANGVCYTCDARDEWKNMQAGHFRHGVLDFDLENVHSQCVRCNKYLHGNAAEYARRIVRDIGSERFEALCKRADEARKGEKHDSHYFLGIEAEFKNQLNQLK